MLTRQSSAQAELLAMSTLRAREQALSYLAEAKATGSAKDRRDWEKEVRQIEKLIRDYALDRCAVP